MRTAPWHKRITRALPLWLGALLWLAPAMALAWTTPQVVDNAADVGKFTTLALDTNNKLHISYFDTAGNLKYATDKSGLWVNSAVTTGSVVSAGTAIAIDASTNYPQINYYYNSGTTNRGIRNRAFNGSAWGTAANVVGTGNFAPATAVMTSLLNKSGFSHAVYLKNGNLYYNTNSTANDYSAWGATPFTLDSTAGIGNSNSLALDAGGKLHVVNYNTSSTDLFYYTNASGSWVKTTLQSSANDVGDYCSIAVGTVGGTATLFVAYLDRTGNNVMFITKPVNGGSWSTPAIAAAAGSDVPNKGGYISLAVDTTGAAHIGFFYATNATSTTGSLKYATNLGGAWTAETVDSTAAAVGQYTSIAVDSGQKVSIAYYDVTNSALKVATKAALLVSPATVDFGTVVPGSQSANQIITVTNNLAVGQTMAAASITGTDAGQFLISADYCSGSLVPPQGTCEIHAYFAPASGTPLARSATLTVSSGAPASQTVALTGATTDTLTIHALAGNGGSISPSGTFTAPRGGSQTFTITAAPGFSIADVTDNSVSQGAVADYSLTNIQNDHTIQASFVSPFRIADLQTIYYGTLVSAYGAAADGESIQSRGIITGESLLVTRNVSARLQGGYDSAFAGQTGSTLLNSITVHIPNDNPGRLIVENVVLK